MKHDLHNTSKSLLIAAMKKRTTTICLSTTAAIALALCLTLLILGLTVFKPKHPITTVDSISLSHLDFSIDVPDLRLNLNLTLATAITVTNPNPVGFRYANTSAFLKYRGAVVGEAPIDGGGIGGRSRRGMNLSLTIMADRLMRDADFYSDAIAGKVDMQTEVRLPGRARVAVFDFAVVAYAYCDIEIHLIRRSLVNQTCRYKTKL